MPKATKVVLHFDDGTTYEIPADGTGSIFLKEEKAKKCGHNPPYKKPPKKTDEAAAPDTATTEAESPEPTMMAMEGSCYLINGVVVCP